MLQTQCVRIPVLPGAGERLMAWIASLAERAPEVLEALRAEGIADEAVFLAREGGSEVLYLYSRSPDLAAAGAAFQASQLAVDLEFKQLMGECLDLGAAEALTVLFSADARQNTVEAKVPMPMPPEG